MNMIKGIIKRAGTVAVALLVVASMSGCSQDNLQKRVQEDADLKAQIESMAVEGLKVSVKENQITYVYDYEQTFEEEILEVMVPELENLMKNTDSLYEDVVAEIKKVTGIREVSVKVQYNNGDGQSIYEKVYK